VRSAARHKIGHRGQNEKFLLDMHSIGVRYRRPKRCARRCPVRLRSAVEECADTLLRNLLSQARIGVLLNLNVPLAWSHLHELQQTGAAIGLRLVALRASDDDGIDAALAVAAQQRVGALLVTADRFFDIRRDKLVAAAARLALPAMYQFREYAAAGGLMGYGIDLPGVYRQVGGYLGKIL
jgi:putative tryptophan/tyrosine transport system substrate-binding protein